MLAWQIVSNFMTHLLKHSPNERHRFSTACVTVIYFQGRENIEMFGVARNTDKWPNAIIFLSNTGIYLILQANPKQPSILQYSRISRAKRTAGPIVRVCVCVC